MVHSLCSKTQALTATCSTHNAAFYPDPGNCPYCVCSRLPRELAALIEADRGQYHGPFYVNEEQTLMCRVWGYYPEDIAVSWFLNGSRVEPSEIKRINSSALELPYRFLPTAESQGMEISCVVEHRALTEPLDHIRTILAPCYYLAHLGIFISISQLFFPLCGVFRGVFINWRKYRDTLSCHIMHCLCAA
uniref:Ig-like domain-containing protein n=1 Tax=Xenopus tropicalis TaxID=8364 RepID=A0A803KCW9_XENTR